MPIKFTLDLGQRHKQLLLVLFFGERANGAGAGKVVKKSSPQNLLEAGTRYRIEDEIARGGMEAILRGVDKDIQREVAVKFLLNSADARQQTRFVEEALTGQLEHPNIVPIHQLGVHPDGHCFFSMKMVKGRSLAQLLKGEPVRQPPVERRRWGDC